MVGERWGGVIGWVQGEGNKLASAGSTLIMGVGRIAISSVEIIDKAAGVGGKWRVVVGVGTKQGHRLGVVCALQGAPVGGVRVGGHGWS